MVFEALQEIMRARRGIHGGGRVRRWEDKVGEGS